MVKWLKSLGTILLLLIATNSFAALDSNILWEVRTTGNNTNGGGFKSGASGTNYSRYDNKNAAGCSNCGSASNDISVTDGVTAGTTTITSATANFTTAIVGNVIYVTGGTGSVSAAWYEVTARASSTSITVDRSTGLTAGTGVTINIGGALLTINQAVTNHENGNDIYVQSGTYAEDVTISGASTNGNAARIIGYTGSYAVATGTDRPLIDATGLTNCMDFGASGGGWSIENIRCDNADNDGFDSSGNLGSNHRFINTKSTNNTGNGYSMNSHDLFILNEASGNAAGWSDGNYTRRLWGNYSHDNTGDGFNHDTGNSNAITMAFNIADSNGDEGFFFYSGMGFNNVAYNNTGNGFELGNSSTGDVTFAIFNNSAQGNGTGYGRLTTTYGDPYFNYNQYNGNSTALGNFSAGTGDVTSTAGFTDAAGGDFTVSGTAAVVNAGLKPSTNVGVVGSYKMNIGVDQIQNSASGSSVTTAFGFAQ